MQMSHKVNDKSIRQIVTFTWILTDTCQTMMKFFVYLSQRDTHAYLLTHTHSL